ncbi:hypothetical protein ACFSKU_19085 [Pontibacter silvestris]|uniref:Late embryogenesis abundant protein n=1 Tax=Pontibacter silvestris TaxID=2305183 RepID=A0ABW4X1Z6_9BACT|nr:hypothetical protein [Pontibacter silvestris]MCC9135002.1 hypothetical protein [Pontibacter silvestris]
MTRRLQNYVIVFMLLMFSVACSTKNDIEAFKEADYSLESLDEVRVNGINLLEIKNSKDFSFGEAAALISAFSDNKLNATSTLGLNVSLDESSKDRTMTVTQLKWQLLLDDQQTLSGLVSEPVELHDGLNTITVKTPVTFSEESGGASLNNLLRLATMLNKEEGQRPKVTLQIKPTIATSVGPLEIPRFINIKE